MPEFLSDWVAEQAARRPDAVAVAGDGRTLTYAELETQSSRLAGLLEAELCRRGDRVCLLMPKSPEAIVAILGIYKTGAIYVPLDPSSPAARLEKIVASCAPRWILAAGPVGAVLDELVVRRPGGAAISVGRLDGPPQSRGGVGPRFTADDLRAAPDRSSGRRRDRRDPAHILFTSGSTGTPKGVVITHASVIRFVEWATRHFGMGPSDRVSCHPPLHFDLSVFDIFGAFAAGAQLHLVPARINLLPNLLADFIRDRGLTQWFSVPSVLAYMAKFGVVGQDDFPALRRLLWCGEVFPTPALIHWMKRLPHVRFTNLYGPTETTIASSSYTVPACPKDGTQPIPIGTACDGEELLILEEDLKPVPDGHPGDLYIRGAGLSPGYWNDPDRTNEVFLADPRGAGPSARIYRTGDRALRGEDGQVYFLGRSDTQIKSRGYRIELGEIESCLGSLASIRECAVVGIPTGGFEGTMICCAYAPAPGPDLTAAALRQSLGRLLPAHMLPSRWMALDRLPRNVNGKIDRVSVKALFAGHEAAAARQS